MAHEIRRLREDPSSQIRTKTYLMALLGSFPVLDSKDIFVRFALQPQLLTIANSYFGMLTKLRYYNVWQSFATQNRQKLHNYGTAIQRTEPFSRCLST